MRMWKNAMALSSTTTGSAATTVERKVFPSGSYFCNQCSMRAVDAESKEGNGQNVETPSLRDTLAQPIEVAFVSREDGQHEELRRVVGMIGNDELLQRLEIRFRRFENDQCLGARLLFALPPVVRLDFWNQIDAGDQTGAQSSFCQSARRVQFWRCHQN